jgi:multiple sugar transport system permease protein
VNGVGTWWRRDRVAYLFILPQLLGFLVFGAYPLVANLVLSTFEWSVLKPPRFVGLDNVVALAEDQVFWKALGNTIVYATAYVLPTLVVSLFLAVLLNLRMRGMAFFRSVYYIPVVTSYVVVAIIWNWLYDFNIGLLNYYLSFVGVGPVRWLLDPTIALYSLVLMAIWKNCGYTVLIYLAALQNIPDEYVEAAKLDGASEWQAFRHVVLPLLKPTTFLVVVMLTIWSFQAFVQPYLMTQGGPVRSTTTLVYYLYQKGFQFFEMGYAALLATSLTLLVFFVTVLQRRFGQTAYEPD